MRAEVGEWADRVRVLPSAQELPDRIVATAASAYFAFRRRDLGAAQQLIATARAEELRLGELTEPWVPAIEVFVSPDPIRTTAETQRRGHQQNSLIWQTRGIMQEAAVGANILSFTRLPPEVRDEYLARITAAMDMAERLGNPNAIAYGARNLAGALLTSEPKRALQLLEPALATAEPLGLELLVGQIRCSIAVLHAGRGRSHDGVVDPASLGSDLFVWLASAYSEVLTTSNLSELGSVAREAIDTAEPSLESKGCVFTQAAKKPAIRDGVPAFVRT